MCVQRNSIFSQLFGSEKKFLDVRGNFFTGDVLKSELLVIIFHSVMHLYSTILEGRESGALRRYKLTLHVVEKRAG